MKLRVSFILVALAAVLATALVGCGSGSGGAASGGAAAGSASRAASGSPSTGQAQPADAVILDAIAKGKLLDGGMTPISGVVVKSKDPGGMYFIAMKFSSKGVADQVGVWATSDLQGSTQIWAVDKVATDSTQWPITSASDTTQYTMSSDGAQQALDALK